MQQNSNKTEPNSKWILPRKLKTLMTGNLKLQDMFKNQEPWTNKMPKEFGK